MVCYWLEELAYGLLLFDRVVRYRFMLCYWLEKLAYGLLLFCRVVDYHVFKG